MDEILKMASNAGMTKEQGEEATGGIFALVKQNLSDEQYQQITSQIPQIDSLVNKEEESSTSTERASGGGLMSNLASMTGGSGGGTTGSNTAALTALIGICGKYGISAKQVHMFLPQVVSLVKKQCGVDIGSMLGLPASGSAETSGSTTGGSQASSMMGSAMGMFGSK